MNGPDNIPNNTDDGTIKETFDLDRDHDGLFTLDSRCEVVSEPGDTDPTGPTYCNLNSAGVKNDTIGVWVGTAPGGINVLAAVGCAGFNVPPDDEACEIDPDNDMDWHIHCPPGDLQAKCPNVSQHQTPVNDAEAKAGNNSLHWGYHLDLANKLLDTTRFRQMAAFMTNPINLTPLPLPDNPPNPPDLELSFYHIAAMMDNNWYNLPPGYANDYGDVQIQTDRNQNPGIDDWSPWDKLAPFQNVYDHIPYLWSQFGGGLSYCDLTPADTGTRPPAPRGVHETMCYPSGIWSSCGNPRDQTTTFQCQNGTPGSQQPSAGNLWVQTKFSLAGFLGQRVRIRWIAMAWEFDNSSQSYDEVGTWVGTQGDEGWYVDDIVITGALQAQSPPLADLKSRCSLTGTLCTTNAQCTGGANDLCQPFANGVCPTKACDATQGDSGFNLSLNLAQAVEDNIVVVGEKVVVSAASTTNPGGCIGGGAQYRFFKNNLLVQDWSEIPTFPDNPTVDASYRVQVRCSIDTTCTSSATASGVNSRSIQVFSGDGTDIPLSVSYNRTANPPLTTLSWPARVQPPSLSGYDVFSGTRVDDGSASTALLPDTNLSTLTPFGPGFCNLANGAPGTTVTATQTVDPPVNTAFYYLVGHNPVVAGGQAALGRRGDGTLRPLAPSCP